MVCGVDLSHSLDKDTQNRIYDAVMKHLVLFFRDQDLSPEAQFNFATNFGDPVEPHPVYPHLPGFDRVVLLENDGDRLYLQFFTQCCKCLQRISYLWLSK